MSVYIPCGGFSQPGHKAVQESIRSTRHMSWPPCLIPGCHEAQVITGTLLCVGLQTIVVSHKTDCHDHIDQLHWLKGCPAIKLWNWRHSSCPMPCRCIPDHVFLPYLCMLSNLARVVASIGGYISGLIIVPVARVKKIMYRRLPQQDAAQKEESCLPCRTRPDRERGSHGRHS